MLKQDSILELKLAICDLIGRAIDKELLVMAEVKQSCISRPLVSGLPLLITAAPNGLPLQGDAFALKQLTFSRGEKLYCFEMSPPSQLTSSLQSPDPWSPVTQFPNPQFQDSDDLCTPGGDQTTHQDSGGFSENCDVFGSQPFVGRCGSQEGGCNLSRSLSFFF